MQDLRLTTIIYSPQAWTCKEGVISIVSNFSLLLRGSLGEGEVERGVGGCTGDKGTFPMYLLCSLSPAYTVKAA